MTEAEIVRYVSFSLIPGLGAVSRNKILKLCGSMKECCTMTDEEIVQRNRNTAKTLRLSEKRLHLFLENRNSEAITEYGYKILRKCRDAQVDVITKEDQRYPLRFQDIPDMPVVLYAKGNLKINEYDRSIGIVGARRCSAEGKQLAIAFSEGKVAEGYAVISGMAKGVDSYANTAAVKNNGYTIAVLGNGPDICYPVEHRKLYEEIVLHGCALSEYPPGTGPRNYMFPERNRPIAALSDELMVIEAGIRSGTGTTVQKCRAYGRKVTFSTEQEGGGDH